MKYIPEFHVGNCLEVLSEFPEESIHMILTDPPYFLDGFDNSWKKGRTIPQHKGVIGKLPIGMKFDRQQGFDLQSFLTPIAKEMIRILKPGGFLLMFSSPRLYHRLAISIENVGFEIRDQYAWHFTKRTQFKAFSLNHFIERNDDLDQHDKDEIIKRMEGRKTPQLRPQFESILCSQKPKNGTFINNWLEHEVGLIDARQKLNNKVPSTVMHIEKSKRQTYNYHLTPKPIRLCEHLIKLFTCERQIVVDPFVGSGTTCIASYNTNRRSVGIDINTDYINIAKKRIEEIE